MTSAPVVRPQPSRPLPIVLQSPLVCQKPTAKVLSFSSNSTSGGYSLPSTGSYSQSSESPQTSSQSSSVSHSQLPKGARPASPQPSRSPENGFHHPYSIRKGRSYSVKQNSGSSWKLDWRGISKIVKWVIPNDKTGIDDKLNKDILGSGDSTILEPREPQNYNPRPPLQKPLPEEPSQLLSYTPWIYASPTSPLSPTTSDTCVDLTSDDECRLYSTLSDGHYSDLGHSVLYTPSSPTSEEYGRTPNQLRTSRYDEHVNSLEYTLVQRTVSDLGHWGLRGAEQVSLGYMSSNNEYTNSETFPCSRRDTLQRPVVHSDIGHYEPMTAPPSAFPSSLSLSYGRDPSYLFNERYPSYKPSDIPQTAYLPSVSISAYNSPITRHRQPRKLRKNMRVSSAARSTQPTPKKDVNLNDNSNKMPIPKKSLVSALSVPIAPKPLPRTPRKLTRKSVKLPPPPRVDTTIELPDIPPPVPPKQPRIINRSVSQSNSPLKRVQLSKPLTSDSTSSANSSASTSHDDSLCSIQVSSSTSMEIKRGGPLTRPSLLRSESNRRWTVAVADSPENVIVEELERLRRLGLRAGDVHGGRYTSELTSEDAREIPKVSHTSHLLSSCNEPELRSSLSVDRVNVEDEMEWIHARFAIFCCRELVRTERSYQARLRELANGQVSDAIPNLLLQYLPGLIGASRCLTEEFNVDMSAVGVANAFVKVLRLLEEAFVPWCGVVGIFFDNRRRRKSMISLNRSQEHNSGLQQSAELGMKTVRSISMSGHGRSVEKLFPRSSTLSLTTSQNAHWLFRPAFSQSSTESSNEEDIFTGIKKRIRLRESEKERKRFPPFRDLAILPTQRVTRYVLLYKDLLKHTPVNSLARSVVEKAVVAASALAQKCDSAQGNSFTFSE